MCCWNISTTKWTVLLYRRFNRIFRSRNYTSQTACTAGTFQNQTGQTTCNDAQAGYFNTIAASNQTACPAGTYRKYRQTSCTDADEGYYVPYSE